MPHDGWEVIIGVIRWTAADLEQSSRIYGWQILRWATLKVKKDMIFNYITYKKLEDGIGYNDQPIHTHIKRSTSVKWSG